MIEQMKNEAPETKAQVETKENKLEEITTEKEQESGLQVAPQGKDDEQAGEKNILQNLERFVQRIRMVAQQIIQNHDDLT